MLAERVFHPSLHQVNLNQAANWAEFVFVRARECLCAMRGHDLLLHFAPRRLSLRCTKCGWDSPGWTIEKSNRGIFGAMPMMDPERDKLKRVPAPVRRPAIGPRGLLG